MNGTRRRKVLSKNEMKLLEMHYIFLIFFSTLNIRWDKKEWESGDRSVYVTLYHVLVCTCPGTKDLFLLFYLFPYGLYSDCVRMDVSKKKQKDALVLFIAF